MISCSQVQINQKHFSRCDAKTVSETTGCPVDKLHEVAVMFCGTETPGRAGNVMYAMGIKQFTHGTQDPLGLMTRPLSGGLAKPKAWDTIRAGPMPGRSNG